LWDWDSVGTILAHSQKVKFLLLKPGDEPLEYREGFADLGDGVGFDAVMPMFLEFL